MRRWRSNAAALIALLLTFVDISMEFSHRLQRRTKLAEHFLDILKHNGTFPDPEDWIDYARTHNFERVDVTTVSACPDCGAEKRRTLGQFVYYSNLCRLQLCSGCGLAYVDTHLPTETLRHHFELSYKDEQYFVAQRAQVFAQIVSLIAREAKNGASILDIGGAKGHLLALIRNVRPDCTFVLNDLSHSACKSALDNYKLEFVEGSIESLVGLSRQFDVLMLIDVIYYERELRLLWRTIKDLLASGGIVVIRVPNRSLLFHMRAWIARSKRQTRIPGFNPEHLYLFSRSYLTQKLLQLGARSVDVLPAMPLERNGSTFARILVALANLVYGLTRGSVILTPSQLLIAKFR